MEKRILVENMEKAIERAKSLEEYKILRLWFIG